MDPKDFCLWLAGYMQDCAGNSSQKVMVEIYRKLQQVKVEATIGDLIKLGVDTDELAADE